MVDILPWSAGQLVQAAQALQGLNEATDQIEMVFFDIRTGNEEDARPALQGAERDVAVGLQGEDLDSGILADDLFLGECDEAAYDLCRIFLRYGHGIGLNEG
ncbi:MAG: hypothetical protein ACJ8DV_09615 [Microvirga sp.]